MTDQEKIKRHDTILVLKERIGGSFGCADGIFAGHPNDEERAKEYRAMAVRDGVTLDEMLDINLSYLFGKSYHIDHIKEQMNSVIKFYSKKLQ